MILNHLINKKVFEEAILLNDLDNVNINVNYDQLSKAWFNWEDQLTRKNVDLQLEILNHWIS